MWKRLVFLGDCVRQAPGVACGFFMDSRTSTGTASPLTGRPCGRQLAAEATRRVFQWDEMSFTPVVFVPDPVPHRIAQSDFRASIPPLRISSSLYGRVRRAGGEEGDALKT